MLKKYFLTMTAITIVHTAAHADAEMDCFWRPAPIEESISVDQKQVAELFNAMLELKTWKATVNYQFPYSDEYQPKPITLDIEIGAKNQKIQLAPNEKQALMAAIEKFFGITEELKTRREKTNNFKVSLVRDIKSDHELYKMTTIYRHEFMGGTEVKKVFTLERNKKIYSEWAKYEVTAFETSSSMLPYCD